MASVTFSEPDRFGNFSAFIEGRLIVGIEPWHYAGRHAYFAHWGPPWHFRRFETAEAAREFISAHAAEVANAEAL